MPSEGMMNFVKALADADRLRIVGLLVKKPCGFSDISEILGFEPSDASHHLDLLMQANVIHLADSKYQLDEKAMENLSRKQFQGQRRMYLPTSDLENDRRRVLIAHLDTDGRLKTIPIQPAKRKIILDYLINAFLFDVSYSEKEVNMILMQFHTDTATLRRYLVDKGMLKRERDGSRYWRPG